MKVLVVGTGGSIVSGITTAADEMARTLPTLGMEAERLNAGEEMRRRANAFNLENVVAVLGDARTVFRRARRGRADVVWIHTFGVPTLPALRALALVVSTRLARRRAVVHFHAYALERLIADGGRPLRLVLRVIMALAHNVVAVHEPAAEALRRIGDRSTVRVVHNWVSVPETMTELPPRPPLRLVFVGGVVRRKGAPQLIAAVRMLDEPVELRIVGGAGEDGEVAFERLRHDADDLAQSGRVSFAGELDAAGVRAELRAAHLFVLPSEAEGMPIAMLEAMAEGRPVLVTTAGNMAMVVEDTGCGWVLPDRDPATIATLLRQLNGDAAGLTQASASAYRAAAECYSSSVQCERIAAILNEAVRRR